MRIRVITALVLGICTVAVNGAAEVINGIAAEVNEEIITTMEVAREYANRLKEEEKLAPVSPEAARKLRSTVLDNLIDKKLVQQKVRELNIVISEEEVRQAIEDIKKQNGISQEALTSALITQGMTFDQYRTQMQEQLERLRLISQEVKSKISVSDQEIRDYYDRHPAEFSEEGGFRARSIFFRLPENATAVETREMMMKMMLTETAIRKKRDFIDLAQKYSDDPNVKQDGGDIGFFKKGEMLPEIETIVVNMKPGEVSEPVSTATGFHLLKLEEQKAAQPLPFDTVKARIEELLYTRKTEERFKLWTEELRKGASITITP